MAWEIPVLLRVLIGHVVHPIFAKKVAGLPSRALQLLFMFSVCLLFSLVFAILTGSRIADLALLPIAVLGVANSFGAYCSWRAINISLSRTALFTQADDFIAILLGYLVLGEAKGISPLLAFGVLIAFASAVSSSSIRAQRGKKKEKTDTRIREQLFWVAGYSVIWGLAVFFMRFTAKEGLGLGSFLVAWYGGSAVGAWVISRLTEHQVGRVALRMRNFGGAGILAVTAWSSLLLQYAAFQRAPIIVVQPIFQITEIVFPALIGLWLFREGTTLSRRERAVFLCGISGVILILIGF